MDVVKLTGLRNACGASTPTGMLGALVTELVPAVAAQNLNAPANRARGYSVYVPQTDTTTSLSGGISSRRRTGSPAVHDKGQTAV